MAASILIFGQTSPARWQDEPALAISGTHIHLRFFRMATDRRHPERGGEVAAPAGTAKPLCFNARRQPGELLNWMMAGVKIVV
jgi:hypothetical protein